MFLIQYKCKLKYVLLYTEIVKNCDFDILTTPYIELFSSLWFACILRKGLYDRIATYAAMP